MKQQNKPISDIHEYYCYECQQLFYMDMPMFQYKTLEYVNCPYCMCMCNYIEILKDVKKNGKK